MYERQFGLRENPFAAGHQSKYVYPSREHQEALAHLRFGIENREAFVLITGEVGTGKTTALYDALSEWKSRALVALITNTALTRSELYEEICMRFGVPLAGPTSKPQLIQQLERHLMVVRARGDYAILLIDEAQNLDSGLLEETRLLSNLEAQGQKLLQIFLVGQPELEDKLAQPELRQLRQRIAVHYRLRPLSLEETERYIHHRIAVAGGHPATLFPSDACAAVHTFTHGIPREINTIAAQALLNAFVEDSPCVQPGHVRAIVEDTGFQSVLDTHPAHPAVPQSPVVPPATVTPPPSPPAASRPVRPSPPGDETATTREVRPVPAPAPPPARSPEPPTPSSIDSEGQPMAGVRPAGSTESWQSWMNSLQNIPVEGETEDAAKDAANEAPAEAGNEEATAAAESPTTDPAEMSPEEFYAVEEAAMRSEIGDELGTEDLVEETDASGEPEYEEDEEYEGDTEDGDEEYEEDAEAEEYAEEAEIEADEYGEVIQELEAAESAPTKAEVQTPTGPPMLESDDVEWLNELTRESQPAAPKPAESAMARSDDFESGPGIQWGDAASRAAEETSGREPEMPALSSRASETMPDVPAAPASRPAETPPLAPAAAVRTPAAPIPAAKPVPPRPAPPARTMSTANTVPMRLRERLEAAERASSSRGSKLTGWLIGVGAVVLVTLGILFAMRMRGAAQAPDSADAPIPVEETATAEETGALDDMEPSATESTEETAVEATPTPPPAETRAPRTSPPVAATAPAATQTTTASTTTRPTSTPVVKKAEAPAGNPPVESAAAAAASPNAQYGVSVGTFLAERRANSELSRLAAATGISGRVVTTPEGDYRVVLGSYPDKGAAENAAGTLIAGGKVDEARVVALAGSKN